MSTFIVGGTGKTGFALAQLLHAAGHPVLIGSRKGVAPEPFRAVAFDWNDSSTFPNPFNVPGHTVTRIYLIAPSIGGDVLGTVKPFIDLAIEKGVKRFVFTSATSIPRGGPFYGLIHDYLATIGVDYAVLRPTCFSDNFAVSFLPTILEKNEFSSPAKDGRIPFVTAHDIAKAAFDKLTEEKSSNSDFYVLGPEYLTYDQAAELLSEVLGRKIVHKHITEEEDYAIWKSYGVDDVYAKGLAHLHAAIANGSEELLNEPNAIIGKETLKQYLTENRNLWVKS